MSPVRLTDLPADILCKVVSLLPLTDRARLEAVCKQFHRISTECATDLKFDLKTAKEAKGILTWLGNLQEIQRPCLQSMRIVLYSPHTFTSGGNSQSSSFFHSYKATLYMLDPSIFDLFGHQIDNAKSTLSFFVCCRLFHIQRLYLRKGLGTIL